MATEPVVREVEEVAPETVELPERPHGARRLWSWLWPKLAALGLFIAAWQLVVWSGWRPDYVLPGPVPVFQRLYEDLGQPDFYMGVAVTLRRALVGYAIAIAIGSVIGLLVARVPIVRKAVGHAILGLQSMPSIAWFPLAILLFQQSEGAILVVVILGAAPAVATGLLAGVDQVQPLLVRVGRVIGARGLQLYRFVILPAALPGYVGGLKQGWAFAWRSLMAGELLGVLGHQKALGFLLSQDRDVSDYTGMMATMVAIFVIGIVVDAVFFGRLES